MYIEKLYKTIMLLLEANIKPTVLFMPLGIIHESERNFNAHDIYDTYSGCRIQKTYEYTVSK